MDISTNPRSGENAFGLADDSDVSCRIIIAATPNNVIRKHCWFRCKQLNYGCTLLVAAQFLWSPFWPSSASIVKHLHRRYTHFTIIDLLITSIIFCTLGFFYRAVLISDPLVEAALEISPIGVQLVSGYGSSRLDQNREDIKYKVRAFLPRQQILDVIVVEVVWPHCVWSQVVFRVVKGGSGVLSIISSSKMQGEAQGSLSLGGLNDGNRNANQNIPDTWEKAQGISRQTQIKSSRNLELLRDRKNIELVPAFPEEFQGRLSYEQCLHYQAKIERLMERQLDNTQK